jgi:hypothetical protein
MMTAEPQVSGAPRRNRPEPGRRPGSREQGRAGQIRLPGPLEWAEIGRERARSRRNDSTITPTPSGCPASTEVAVLCLHRLV